MVGSLQIYSSSLQFVPSSLEVCKSSFDLVSSLQIYSSSLQFVQVVWVCCCRLTAALYPPFEFSPPHNPGWQSQCDAAKVCSQIEEVSSMFVIEFIHFNALWVGSFNLLVLFLSHCHSELLSWKRLQLSDNMSTPCCLTISHFYVSIAQVSWSEQFAGGTAK